MGRWEPDARGRLAKAAMELYAEHGHFDTERAELSARFAARIGALLERLETPHTA